MLQSNFNLALFTWNLNLSLLTELSKGVTEQSFPDEQPLEEPVSQSSPRKRWEDGPRCGKALPACKLCVFQPPLQSPLSVGVCLLRLDGWKMGFPVASSESQGQGCTLCRSPFPDPVPFSCPKVYPPRLQNKTQKILKIHSFKCRSFLSWQIPPHGHFMQMY